MKHFLTILIAIFFSANLHAQTTTNIYWTEQSNRDKNDVIYYHSEQPLKWADFRGSTPDNGPVAAITTSGFGYKADMSSSGGKVQINIGVYCFFSRGKSWVRDGRNTDYILNHEQHHFDASYIAANIFMDRVKNTNITSANCNDLLPKIYKECCDIMNKMQNDYDGQTMNGRLETVQAKWNGFFNEKLAFVTK